MDSNERVMDSNREGAEMDAPTTYDARGIAHWTSADGSTEIRANHWGTHNFAFENPAGRWLCSDLAGAHVSVTLAPNGDLVDGLFPDCLGEELSAFIDYALERVPA